MTAAPVETKLADYRPFSHEIPDTHITIDIKTSGTVVTNTFTCQAKPGQDNTVVLNGEKLELLNVHIDGHEIDEENKRLTDTTLTLSQLPPQCTITITTKIDPYTNYSGEGLYQSGTILCTQMEAEGFRKLTYWPDRPDVMSTYTTTLIADKNSYPILLSNGNLTEETDLDDDRHSKTWHDPFPKPCYLYAVVAGDLDWIEDHFITKSGRNVTLQIYVDKGNTAKSTYAMECLKNAMKWDEEVYNREYDLDIFMIVAVDSFNMGAMENKGLNIFNSQYILADPKTATDSDYLGIDGVVAHEYFHNWTGNRITCRDWFQLTLKEGLTVYRDEEYTADTHSRPVKRIQDVRVLRNYQFAEDDGPNAHPIQPESYIKIDNFYTSTIYNKGAEVIRMIATLIGHTAFFKGMDHYFATYDGQAVTTEEFISSMETGSGQDLNQFRRWYHQAGTPHCDITSHFDSEAQTFTLTISQSCKDTPETPSKEPFVIPIKIGLLDQSGTELSNTTLVLDKESDTFTFTGLSEAPIPSIFRDFSAPVTYDYPYQQSELQTLLHHDTDPFNQYEASQRIIKDELSQLMAQFNANQTLTPSATLPELFNSLLFDPTIDITLKAEFLSMPSLSQLLQPLEVFDIDAGYAAKQALISTLATHCETALLQVYTQLNHAEEFRITPEAMAQRSLKNKCLYYLSKSLKPHTDLIISQYRNATNMTDQIAALSILSNSLDAAKTELSDFETTWHHDHLVMNKWFAIQARSEDPNTLETIKTLQENPHFDAKNPNRIRALYGAFAGNLPHFHAPDGSGYTWHADQILKIDTYNPSIASRLATAFKTTPKLDPDRKAKATTELNRILSTDGLSADTFEIVNNTLKS